MYSQYFDNKQQMGAGSKYSCRGGVTKRCLCCQEYTSGAKAFRTPCLASPPLTFPDLGLLRGTLTAAARLQPSQARALCEWVLHLLQLYSSYNLGQVPAQCNFAVASIKSYD